MLPASEPIKFGEWMPDMGAFDNPGALTVKNCISLGDVYKPFSSAAESSGALPAGAIGGYAYRDASGNTTLFAGTRTKLYRLTGTTWMDATRTTGGDYTTATDGYWFIRSFGNLIIATNYNDDIQCLDMGAGDTHFSKLATNSPRARGFFFLQNYMVAYDVADTDGARKYRVRWSPLANPRGDWTDIINGADFQDIYEGDAVAFGEKLQNVGALILGNSIWRMDYVGGSDIFQFNIALRGRGTILGRACVANGQSIFFPDQDGFYSWDDATLTAIGNMKIDDWFYTNFNQTYDYNMNAVVDPIKKNILFAFPSTSASTGICDLMLCFNWITKRWTLIEEVTEILFSFLSIGYTMDGLNSYNTNLDLIPYSLDSRIWTGGKTVLGCFTTNHKLAAFSGATKTATIGTPELRLNSSGQTQIEQVIPYVEGGKVAARLGVRNVINQSPGWTAFALQNSMTGEIDLLKQATYHRAEVQISGAWNQATGLAVRSQSTGMV